MHSHPHLCNCFQNLDVVHLCKKNLSTVNVLQGLYRQDCVKFKDFSKDFPTVFKD